MINLNELRLAIRKLKRHQQIYKVLRDELSEQGYWKKQPRGNPKKGYNAGLGLNK